MRVLRPTQAAKMGALLLVLDASCWAGSHAVGPAPPNVTTPEPSGEPEVRSTAASSRPAGVSSTEPPSSLQRDGELPREADKYLPVAAGYAQAGQLREALAVLAFARKTCGLSAATLALAIDLKVQLRLWDEAIADLELLRGVRPNHAARLELEYRLDQVDQLAKANDTAALVAYLATSPPQPWRDLAEEKHDRILLEATPDGPGLDTLSLKLLSQSGKAHAAIRLAAYRNRAWQGLVIARFSCSYRYQTLRYDGYTSTAVYGSRVVTTYTPPRSESDCAENTVKVSIKNKHAKRVHGRVFAKRDQPKEFSLWGGQELEIETTGDCFRSCDEFGVTVDGGDDLP